jgi:two-component system, chemotaxis family, sensor kinase CheA
LDLSEMNAAFLDELEEQLETMEHGILQLERTPESDEAVQDLFRSAHTIKGAAAVMEFESMKHLTHHMEYVLDEVRGHRVQVERSMVDLLFECLDQLRDLKEQFAGGADSFSDVSALVTQLKGLLHRGVASVNTTQSANTNTELELDSSLQTRFEEYLLSGHFVARVEVAFNADVLLKSARAMLVCNALDDISDVLHILPDVGDPKLEDDQWDNLIIWIATKETSETVQRTAENCGEVINVSVDEWFRQGAEIQQPFPYEHNDPNKSDLEGVDASGATGQDLPRRPAQAQPQTIRVDVQRLEDLMNLVGELVIDRTRVHMIGDALGRKFTSSNEVKDLESVSAHMARIVSDLQENVMLARMLPIERVFNRFPRMVRSLASQLAKEVDLVIEGQGTQLDRTLIDEIGDPLIHLIRNAVDHGLEKPEIRQEKGKPAQGKLHISAGHEENHIVIVVEDDGAGIHPEKMRTSALKKGLITTSEAEALTDAEAQQLIFRPGFSTAAEITDVSGRGVGMDIVRANIEKLQGMVEIFSTPDVGTRFEVKLPLTLAIVRGLLVGVDNQTFVIPITSVAEIIRESVDSIQTVNGRDVLWVRGQTLPVRWLHDEFGILRPKLRKKNVPIVVVGIGNQKIGFVVNELKGNQEIVKKSLGLFVGAVYGISGCTILGDGRVAMILDVADLCNRSVREATTCPTHQM